MEVDRSTVVGTAVGGLSGVPLAPTLVWFVKVFWGLDMPLMEVALPICVAGSALVGALQGIVTHLVPSSPRKALTNAERREKGLLPDLNQPLSVEDIQKIKEVIGCGPSHGTI